MSVMLNSHRSLENRKRQIIQYKKTHASKHQTLTQCVMHITANIRKKMLTPLGVPLDLHSYS